jgi:ABC-type uncharacterized transport system permease subunit
VKDFLINWIANVPVTAVPYALAALGLIVSERSGVLNLTAEGLMLIGALAAAGTSLTLGGYPAIALLVAMLAASVVSLLFAALVVVLRVNQVIAGLSVVFFCQGLTGLIGTLAKWQNKQIAGLGALGIWPLSEIPVIGRIFFMQDPVVYLTVLIFFAVNFVLFRTMLGLRLRAVGENPAAADAAGVSVSLHRILAIVAGSSLIGLAGGYISVVSVLFGCVEALIPHVAAAGIRVPQYLMLMTPYLATIAVMIWVGAKDRRGSQEPGALGQPHVREERR